MKAKLNASEILRKPLQLALHALLLALLHSSPILSAHGASTPLAPGFTYQGRFFTPDGTAPMTDTVDLTLGIYNPSGTCLLYEEHQTSINLSTSSGLFSVRVGSAASDPKRTARDPGKTLAQIFSNNASIRVDDAGTTNTCPGGYIPSTGHARVLRVTIYSQSNGTTETLSPDLTINSVPQATVAETLQGYSPSDFIRTGSTTTESSLDKLTDGSDANTAGAGSTALHHHDSRYMQAGSSSNQDMGSGVSHTSGSIGIGTGATTGAKLEVQTSASSIGQIIKAAASQVADLFQIKDSSNTVKMKIDKDGVMTMPNRTPASDYEVSTKKYVDDLVASSAPAQSVATTASPTFAGMTLDGNLSFSGARTIQPLSRATSGTGNDLTLRGGAASSGTGGSIHLIPGSGAGGPGPGSVYIGSGVGWTNLRVNGAAVFNESGPNTGTAFTLNAGGYNAFKVDWDNLSNFTSYALAPRSARFTNATSYSFSGGKVGIGTTAPDAMIHSKVTGDSLNWERIAEFGASKIDGTEAHSLRILTYLASGNRIIKLSPISTTGAILEGNWSVGGQFTPVGGIVGQYHSDLNIDQSTNGSGTPKGIRFRYAGTTRMSVMEDGKVGIGTTIPNEKLEVAGNVIVNGMIKMAKNAAAPATCAAAYDGYTALTSGYRQCVCNGTSWVFTSDGTTACTW